MAANHEAAEQVVTNVIGAEKVFQARPLVLYAEIGEYLIGVVEDRTEEAKEGKENDDEESQHGEAVLGEYADGEPKGALSRFRFAGIRERPRGDEDLRIERLPADHLRAP